jgi:predicted  nucleic acid-binding Zn-ribbon protein
MSNARDLRKKIAQLVADEIFTINTELDNLTERLHTTNIKALQKVSYERLRDLRYELQTIKAHIQGANSDLNNISKGWSFAKQHELLQPEDGSIQQILIGTRTMENMEDELTQTD